MKEEGRRVEVMVFHGSISSNDTRFGHDDLIRVVTVDGLIWNERFFNVFWFWDLGFWDLVSYGCWLVGCCRCGSRKRQGDACGWFGGKRITILLYSTFHSSAFHVS